MKKLVAQIVSKAGAVLTLFAFFVSNVAAQSLPLSDQSRSAADTIIRRIDTGAQDRVAWLAKAREGLLEASAGWEHKLLASGVAPGAFTAGLSAALDAAYEERLVSGFFEQASDTVASPLAASERQGGISAGKLPELALSPTGSITTAIAASANAWASAKTYEGRALTVAELGGAIGGGSYSEYRVTAHSAQAGAASAAYLSVTAVKERSQRLAEQATAMLTQKAGANLTVQADTGSREDQTRTNENRDARTAARGTLEGLGYWSKAEALIGIKEDTAMNPAQSSTSDNATPTMRQSWLSYNATQDALAEIIAERLLKAKDAWLTQAETELSHPNAEAQFLGTDADNAVRSCLVLVVPAKDFGQVTAEHREAESHSAQGNTQRATPASEDHPAAGNGDTPTAGINQKTEPVQKPNLLQKALQLLQSIVQSQPMDKVESSNRSASAHTPIFDDHGSSVMKQEQGTGGVSGTSSGSSGSSGSGKTSSSSGNKQTTQQAAMNEVNNKQPESTEPITSPIEDIKDLENEKATIRSKAQTTQEAATAEIKQDNKATTVSNGKERAEALEPVTTEPVSTAPHQLGMNTAGTKATVARSNTPRGMTLPEDQSGTTPATTAPHELGISTAGNVTEVPSGIARSEDVFIPDTEVYSEPHELGFKVEATPEPPNPNSNSTGANKAEALDKANDQNAKESKKRTIKKMAAENLVLLENYSSEQFFSEAVNVSGRFEQRYAFPLNDGINYEARHDGIDYVLADKEEPANVVAPLNLEVVSVSESTIILSVVGKPEINIGLAHLNPEELKAYKKGDVIAAGTVIASFPTEAYGNNTTAPHVHVTALVQDKDDPKTWTVVNPDTFEEPSADLLYRKQNLPIIEYTEYTVEKSYEPAFYMDSEYEEQYYQPDKTSVVTNGEEHVVGYAWSEWKVYRWR